MRIFLSIAFLFGGLAGVSCAQPGSGPAWEARAESRIEVHGYGLSFRVPANWRELPMEHGKSYAGPGRSAYTPIIVQPRATRAPLDLALDELTAPLVNSPSFVAHRRFVVAVGGVLALGYEVSFEHHETPRRRLGVIVPTSRGLVDIALAANEDLFHEGLAVYDRVLDSLMVTDPVVRDL
ncbi:MAG: hypothetical protein AAF654_02695 [Myxococcota bacterium]